MLRQVTRKKHTSLASQTPGTAIPSTDMERPDDMSSRSDGPERPEYGIQPMASPDSSFESDLLSISDASDNESTTASTSSNGTSSLNPSSGTSRPCQKRRHAHVGDNAGSEDDSSSQPRRNKRPRLPGPDRKPKRMLACPLWKANPDRHRDCFPKILSRIRDVKQHLRRRHPPQFYCERCKTTFPDEQARDQHVSQPGTLSCTPSPTLDCISHQQHWEISRKANPKLSEEDQWFAIWDIVFPGRRRPPSAYRDADISEDLYLFQGDCRTHGAAVLDDEIQSRIDLGIWQGPLLSSDQRSGILRWVLDEGLGILWRSTRAASGAAQSNLNGMLPPHFVTPAVSSQPDSAVAVGTEPPPSDSQPDTMAGGGVASVERDSAAREEPAGESEEETLRQLLPSSLEGDDSPLLDLGVLSGPPWDDWDPFQGDQDQVGKLLRWDSVGNQQLEDTVNYMLGSLGNDDELV
ncbi:hypothetical protein C8A00DRAFT_11577 [Chaetomidium leptoderma]|uniref:C2H2-type domain-containing protein n=1 Tax=Chaetomidium leptoderma TaxID=669021 RepID=A0AAN7A0I9_9PEZI|nr:hypothetical protein C8A00DRAFT_11577 [Chaetomidium leptoderma]